MSKRAFTAIGVVLLVAVAGVVIFTLLQPQAAVMSDGPGMLYFYSPT